MSRLTPSQEAEIRERLAIADYGSASRVISCLVAEIDALRAERVSVEELAKARLEEATWWEHLVGAVDPKHPDGKSETCMYCQRLVELTRLAKEQTT